MQKAIHPVYTEIAECQDCYKCVRYCPVKSIKITEHHAAVIDEDCTACGHCVTICPSGAKKSRSDIEKVQRILKGGKEVVLSLAPSYVATFSGVEKKQLISLIKRAGFTYVSETALGAEAVSKAVALFLKKSGNLLSLSTACPAAVRFIQRYKPELTGFLTPFTSPLLTHAAQLKEKNPDCAVVFAGPCIAKKLEADANPELLDAALTFDELQKLITEGEYTNSSPSDFYPNEAGIGGLYPIDGGMIRGIIPLMDKNDNRMITVSGLENICKALDNIDVKALKQPLFLELLACQGGCINGPAIGKKDGSLLRILAVEERANNNIIDNKIKEAQLLPISTFESNVSEVKVSSLLGITEALKSLGKTKPEDELNCGGCGYNDCRSLARALVEGRAESAMCVSYMRKLAQRKANVLIKSLPLGVVMVDNDLKVIECNRSFAAMCGSETLSMFDNIGSLEGIRIEKLMPIAEYFAGVLQTNEEIVGREISILERIFRMTLFPVEKGMIAGAVLIDITEPSLSKEAVIQKAQQVIDRQLSTVQQIACLLGESAAETEVLLKSLITAFSVKSRK